MVSPGAVAGPDAARALIFERDGVVIKRQHDVRRDLSRLIKARFRPRIAHAH
jgi:hypothetical protein